MADAQEILRATTDEVDDFARRRTNDEHSQRLYRDLATTAPNGAIVAKDAGAPVGIAIAHAQEDEWFLSDIFVEPSFRGRGLALQLLRSAAADAGDVARSGLVYPSELASAAFYLKLGVPLQTPVVRIAGAIPRDEELARIAAGEYRFTTAALDPERFGSALAALDRETRGTARARDHAYFQANAHGTAFFLENEFIGYAYVWPSGRIGPLAAVSATYLVQLLGYAMATLRSVAGATWCTAVVPATNVRIMRAVLKAGLTIEETCMFASDAPMLDLSRYIGFHPLLF
ncbi:MAG: GNAT family N-acetyltransferase [Candidatus Eremiobacteraeota bacterium]|nr:GNAT family N-acetyltransferase [Candidatus Eremiobacteraeota bacterium]